MQANVIAAAEAQQRRGPMQKMSVDEFALGAIFKRQGAPVSGSISSKWTKPRPEKCMPAPCSHSPHREIEMSPMPIASATLAPQAASSRAAQRRLAAAGLAGHQHARCTLEFGEIDTARRRPFGQVQRIGRGQARSSGLSNWTAAISRSVFPAPTGMWQRPSR